MNVRSSMSSIGTSMNHSKWPIRTLRKLFDRADRDRLRAAGDPIPGVGPFTIYRGVGGRGRARHVRGLSWPASRERARWFAQRAQIFGLHDPAVYCVTVDACHVLAFVDSADANGRGEEEFVVLLPQTLRPVRLESVNIEKGGA